MGMDWPRLLAYISGTVDQDLLLRNEYLVAENRILRAQIKGRRVSGELLRGSLISLVIAAKLRKWAESHFWDACRTSETMGAAKHAAMEKLRTIS